MLTGLLESGEPLALPSTSLSEIELVPGRALCLLVDVSSITGIQRDFLGQFLSGREREQYAGILVESERIRRQLTRAVLRLALGHLTGLSPDRVVLGVSKYGKPYLGGSSDVKFNVSHAGAYCLLALSLKEEIGCDIERIIQTGDLDSLSRVVLHEDEARAVLALRGRAAQEAFTHCWVRKEAALKATGVGLSVDPTHVNVGLMESEIHLPLDAEGVTHPALKLHCATPAEDYMAAVASPFSICQWSRLRL